jgi:DnaK suppressor protein
VDSTNSETAVPSANGRIALRGYACPMDEERARELLGAERQRIERGLAAIDRTGPAEGDDQVEPGDRDSEDLYQDEFDEGHRQELMRDLASLDRAEERLANGKYGLSVESGEPIPDGRLEAVPTAERTVEEEERYRRGG